MNELSQKEIYKTFERENSDNFSSLGRAIWLWMSSEIHQSWPLSLARDTLVPAITLGQYILLERDGLPVGYVSWAHMSLEAEIRYLKNPSGIKLSDWKSGDRIWFIDWMTPFSKRDTVQLKKEIDARHTTKIARSLRIRPDSASARVYEFHGINVPPKEARKQFDELQKDVLESLKKDGAKIEAFNPKRQEPEDAPEKNDDKTSS